MVKIYGGGYNPTKTRERRKLAKTFSFSEIFCKGGFSRLGGDIR